MRPILLTIGAWNHVAAVYDHAVVDRAIRARHAVAFFALEGQLQTGSVAEARLRSLADLASAADRGTARVSIAAAALSVAYDPRNGGFAALEKSIATRFSIQGITPLLLRVMETLMPVVFSNTATIGRHHSSCTLQYTTSSLPAANALDDNEPATAMARVNAVGANRFIKRLQ